MWETVIYKIGVLFSALSIIFGSASSNQNLIANNPPDSKVDVVRVVEKAEQPVFPDSEEFRIVPRPNFKEDTVPPPPPGEPKEEIKDDIVTPPSPSSTVSLLDLQKKVEELTAEVHKQLSEITTEPSLFNLAGVNNKTRASLVNILCLSTNPKVRSITGSGVVVDDRGVILTNAHIGQYFLLEDHPSEGSINCVVRGGSPARPLYKASLLYIPKAWVLDNKTVITDEHPRGTGKNDYAFLVITKVLNGESVGVLPYLPMLIADHQIEKGLDTVVAGYAAGFLSGSTVQKELYPVSAISTVKELFTFSQTTLDLLSVGGSVVAQGGSSGGAVVNEEGYLIGVIVTSTGDLNFVDRDLRAITVSHIQRSLESGGTTLQSLLGGDIVDKASDFNLFNSQELRQILIDSIEGF